MKNKQNSLKIQISLNCITRKFKTVNDTAFTFYDPSVDISNGDEVVLCGPSGTSKSALSNGFIDSSSHRFEIQLNALNI